MMMRLTFLSVVLFAASTASAQTEAPSADAQVRAVVDQLFDGMRAKDTTAIRRTLHPDARLMTAAVQNGSRSVVESALSQFLVAVASAPVLLDEQIPDDYPVLIDDGLAVAWTPYRFYAGGALSHCGTNAFLLALSDRGWQIVQIMDTRQPECE